MSAEITTGASTDNSPIPARSVRLLQIAWVIQVSIVTVMLVIGTFTYIDESQNNVLEILFSRVDDGTHVIVSSPLNDLALSAGIQEGDELIAINGESINLDDYDPGLGYFLEAPSGENVDFTLRHPDGTTSDYSLPASRARFRFTQGLIDLGFSREFAIPFILIFEWLTCLPFLVVALVLFIRRRDNVMAVLLSMLLFTLDSRLTIMYLIARIDFIQPGLQALLTVAPLAVIVGTYLLTFPTGRFRSRAEIVLLIAYLALEVYAAHTLILEIYLPLALTFYIITVVRLVHRYRTQFTLVQRQQAKWMIVGVVFGIIGFYLPSSSPLTAAPSWQAIVNIASQLILLVVPITLAFSIIRYRLYEVDLVINRGLVYGALAAILVAVFAVVFVALRTVLLSIFGAEQDAIVAAISTAAVILLYNPTRKRLQHFVDRRVFKLRVGLDDVRRTNTPISTPNVALPMQQIGGYALKDVLGRGGMGEVYRAEQIASGRPVALKLLRPDIQDKREFRLRFEREAKTLAALHHPNIVQLYGYGVENDTYYMVLEFIDGQTLADYYQARTRLSLTEALPIIRDVAAALDYAHERQIVHRDVKPRNIMLRRTADETRPSGSGGVPQAVLMDFGIVKLLELTSGGLTSSGMVGTIDYAAPEQIASASEVDGRADIYALGVVTYQILTGEAPFKGGVGQVLFAHLQQPPPDPRKIDPTLPPQAATAIMRCLAKKAEARLPTRSAWC